MHQKLEAAVSEWAEVDNVVSCSSGTAALHLALESLSLPKGGHVLVPDFTYIACARAVTLANMQPIFVDVNREDLLLDTTLLGKRAAAVMAVHVYGRRVDMDAVHEYAAASGAKVVEDMSQCHGLKPDPRTHAVCWSFNRTKVVHGEEGGCVAFRDPEDASVARSLRSMGSNGHGDYVHRARGHNYRLADCLAKLILDSLDGFDRERRKRRRIEEAYNKACPMEWIMPERLSPWFYDARVPGLGRKRMSWVVTELNRGGILARHSFKPCRRQDEYLRCSHIAGRISDGASEEVLLLPLTCKEQDVELIVGVVNRALGN